MRLARSMTESVVGRLVGRLVGTVVAGEIGVSIRAMLRGWMYFNEWCNRVQPFFQSVVNSVLLTHELNVSGYPFHFTSDFIFPFLITFSIL